MEISDHVACPVKGHGHSNHNAFRVKLWDFYPVAWKE